MWPFGRFLRRARLGPHGERLAAKFLRRQGMKVLARNYRCPVGEADLIVLDGSTRPRQGAETIVFVEVKTKASDHFTNPESAVNAEKRRRIKKVAGYYLASRATEGLNVRYDIVAVVIRKGEKARIRHIPAAFQ